MIKFNHRPRIKPLLLALLVCTASCSSDKEYVVRINSMDLETKTVSEKVETIKAANDSLAFKRGCSTYWAHKASTLEVNKLFEGTEGHTPTSIPFYFSVETKSGSPVSYSKEVAERLTRDIVNYYQTKVLPRIDTITPIAKKPKEDPAKIY